MFGQYTPVRGGDCNEARVGEPEEDALSSRRSTRGARHRSLSLSRKAPPPIITAYDEDVVNRYGQYTPVHTDQDAVTVSSRAGRVASPFRKSASLAPRPRPAQREDSASAWLPGQKLSPKGQKLSLKSESARPPTQMLPLPLPRPLPGFGVQDMPHEPPPLAVCPEGQWGPPRQLGLQRLPLDVAPKAGKAAQRPLSFGPLQAPRTSLSPDRPLRRAGSLEPLQPLRASMRVPRAAPMPRQQPHRAGGGLPAKMPGDPGLLPPVVASQTRHRAAQIAARETSHAKDREDSLLHMLESRHHRPRGVM